MSSGGEPLRDVIDEMVLVLAPLVAAAQSPGEATRLLADLGWTVASVPPPLLELADAGSDLLDLLGSEPDEVEAIQALAAIGRLAAAIDAIRTRPESDFPGSVDITLFKQTIGRDLLDYCVVEYLLGRRFKLGRLLKLMGIIRLIEVPARGLRQTYQRRYVNWAGAGTLLTDPVTGFRDAYAWSSATPQLADALSDVAAVLESYDLQLSAFQLTADQLAFANAGATEPPAGALGICVDLGEALGVPRDSEAGVRFLLRAPTAERGAAIAALPFANLSGSTGDGTEDGPSVAISGDADLTQGFAVTLAPGHEPTVDAGFLRGTRTNPTRMQVTLWVPPAPGEPERIVVGAPDGGRLSLHTVTLSAGATLVAAQQLDAFVELGLEKLRVVVKPAVDEADSFVADLLGPDGISAELSAGVRLSSLTGFHLTGSGRLEGIFAADAHLGPVDVQAIAFGLKPAEQGFDFDVGATVSGKIGPVAVVVDRVGFRLATRFPDPPLGNLGPLDFALGFKPPNGVGLAIDAGAVTGGGFLFFDPERELYAGAVQLELSGIALKAIGLLTTRMPDGSKGFSLLVIISAEFTPMQLGLGFTLNAVGGLVGVNRTVAVEPLRAGLKSNALAAILFPPDPVGNARQLVASLSVVFPPAAGRFLFGPMARIGWGTPTLVTIDICLVLELPAPVRLIILGRLRAVLPDEDAAVVRLQMDVLGVIDFDRREAAVDATLVDSRLASFALTGDMAMRLSWGASPTFLLAVGGFNPRFLPPPGFPRLDRVAVALATGDNPRLRLEAYLALTSNTVQIGARLELSVRAGSFTIAGFLAFDALMVLKPLSFVVDISGSLAVKAGSRTILSVTLKLTLSGPEPWHARGRASFSILFFDVSVSFEVTIGAAATPALPAAVEVAPRLLAALRDARSWSAQLPAAGEALVTLRSVAPTGKILCHPHGTLQVRQRVVPLERTLERFGSEVPSGARFFRVAIATLGGKAAQTEPLDDLFAPAQFTALTDDQKLSQPSFVAMRSGVRVGEHDVGHGTPLSVEVVFEQKVVSRA
jgi:hypothetical protein